MTIVLLHEKKKKGACILTADGNYSCSCKHLVFQNQLSQRLCLSSNEACFGYWPQTAAHHAESRKYNKEIEALRKKNTRRWEFKMTGHLEKETNRKKCRREVKANKSENKNKWKILRGNQWWARDSHTSILTVQGEENAGSSTLQIYSVHAQERQTRRSWQLVEGKEILLLVQLKPLIFARLGSGICSSPAGNC